MFEKTAAYYDKFYNFLDYKTATENLRSVIDSHHGSAGSLLDVACGTGHYLEYLKKYYQGSGLDVLGDLLEQARIRCPEVPFYLGDMTNFDLGKKFDIITCLFCSIGYVQTVEKMAMAIRKMSSHLNSGGLLIVEPWISPEQCWTGRVTCDVAEEADIKVVRMYTHKREDAMSIYDIHTLVGTSEGVEHFTETEKMGLFTQQEYLLAFHAAGLTASFVDVELFPGHKYGLYLGKKIQVA
ncbi:MAG: class I SAM-dependent methyltransferase [Pseudomonadales bacterium]